MTQITVTNESDAQTLKVTQQDRTQAVCVEQASGRQAVNVNPEVEFLKGEPGFSPTIDVERVEDGHNVTVVDKEGTETFFVPSGSQVTDEQVNAAVSDYLTKHPIEIDVADEVAENDPRPVSSAAVHVEIGNIDAILKTI